MATTSPVKRTRRFSGTRMLRPHVEELNHLSRAHAAVSLSLIARKLDAYDRAREIVKEYSAKRTPSLTKKQLNHEIVKTMDNLLSVETRPLMVRDAQLLEQKTDAAARLKKAQKFKNSVRGKVLRLSDKEVLKRVAALKMRRLKKRFSK